MEQSYVIRNDRVIGKTVPNINYNYSTCPIGSIFAFSSERIPLGFLNCDGASYKVAEYLDLYAVIGNTYGGDTENFNVPDYRETVLVGVGENTTDTIASHDVYELGEFKDDQLQTHTHKVKWHATSNSGSTSWIGSGGGNYPEDSYEPTSPARTGTTTHGKQKGVTYIIKAFHTNEGVDSGVSDSVVEYVDNKINDSVTDTNSTWSSNKIAQQINNATAIKYDNVINANATKETGWNLAQGESHFYGKLLQLDGHLGSKSSTFSFLLFVKANYDNPTTVYATQLAGMDDDRSNIAHTTYFELGVSSDGNLTIKNKSAVVASYRFI